VDSAAGVWFQCFTQAGLLLVHDVTGPGFSVNADLYRSDSNDQAQGRSLKITIAYPIMVGGGFVIIALVARFHPILAEKLTIGQWVGVFLVMIGIMLLAFGMDRPVSSAAQ